MHHRLLVHLRLETKMSIMAKILKTLILDHPSPKVVCHKDVVGLLHVVGVVESRWEVSRWPVRLFQIQSRGALHERVSQQKAGRLKSKQ